MPFLLVIVCVLVRSFVAAVAVDMAVVAVVAGTAAAVAEEEEGQVCCRIVVGFAPGYIVAVKEGLGEMVLDHRSSTLEISNVKRQHAELRDSYPLWLCEAANVLAELSKWG